VLRLLYWFEYPFYHWPYAPLAGQWFDFKHRHDPPLPTVPCQICGGPGHLEAYSSNAKSFGFLDLDTLDRFPIHEKGDTPCYPQRL
jgi:hypothetical protein